LAEVVEEGKSKVKLSMIILLVVLGIVLAGAVSFFVAVKFSEDKSGGAVTDYRAPGAYVKIGDPRDGVVVNVGGVTGRYLKIVMTLEVLPTRESGADATITPQDEIKINDSVIKFLRSQDIEAFTPENQGELKTAVKKTVNDTLGSSRVVDVFITNLVVQ